MAIASGLIHAGRERSMQQSGGVDRSILVMTLILLIGFAGLGFSALIMSLPDRAVDALRDWQTLLGAIIALAAAVYATQFVKKQINISNNQYNRMLDQVAVSNRQALIDMVEQFMSRRNKLDTLISEISPWAQEFDLKFTSFKRNPIGHGVQRHELHEMCFNQFSRLHAAQQWLCILMDAADTPPLVKDGVSHALKKIKPELDEYWSAQKDKVNFLNIIRQIKNFEYFCKKGQMPEADNDLFGKDATIDFLALLPLSQRTVHPHDFFPTYIRIMMVSNAVAMELRIVNGLYDGAIEALRLRVRKLDLAIIKAAEMATDHCSQRDH